MDRPDVRTYRVLVVEDNYDHAESLRRILESRTEVKYLVEVAATVKDAVARLRQNGIDAVLLDLRLPDGTGLDVIRTVASASPESGIVVLTGLAGEEIKAPAKAAGANDVLIKPAEPVAISEKLQSAIIYKKSTRDAHDTRKLFTEIGDIILGLSDKKDDSAERKAAAVRSQVRGESR